MRIVDYLKLGEDGRTEAFRAARDAAETFEFEAAKLLLAGAAEEIRKHWPDAVAAVLETNPHEHFYALSGVQAADQRLLWTRSDGLVDKSQGDDDELWDLAYEIGRTIQDARELRANILEEIEGDVWHYAFILDHWLTPEDDDEPDAPDAPDGSAVYTLEWGDKHNQGLSLHATNESAVKEKARIARESWNEISDLDGVPDTAPEDDAEAARIFYDIAEDQGHGTWASIDCQTVQG